jgi:hypothetical protein
MMKYMYKGCLHSPLPILGKKCILTNYKMLYTKWKTLELLDVDQYVCT